ncbi:MULTISPECIES: NADH-quinone oxidoreductase subunit NuoG [unclassified Thalassospira]|uniref:NADH-quinone oxidoreductase subunit NuoG n=1 Tax=unclassified Thalassospira TaxID=2648997 RepID=UPI0025D42F11|nr:MULTISPECIES: NADH-quinone oxidoreductase subunit NuoG [unclassified Thalassospira]|tara:strand:+ start:268 stop:2328 length:2061 start_codon:yes stop_codon:yes gene_type:complete
MPKLTVDGIEVEVEAGATVLQACEEAGKEIPRFCYHERLSIAGNCRMCLVEMERAPKPVASCAMPAADGMVIKTDSDLVKKARNGVMEFLLINHPLDCPICDQGGECDLQDQAMAYGFDSSRYAEKKRAVKDKELGPIVKTIMTRCIHCTRCVRFSEEVAGVGTMGAVYRGEDTEVGPYIEASINSELSGNLVDLCPVGALTSKPYAFTARPWELKKTDSVDVMDAVGSNIRIDARTGEVMRVLPRTHEDINEEWISDKTRYAIDGLKRQRLDRPYVRKDGKLQPASWDEAFAAIKAKVSGLAGNKIAALAGDTVDCESMTALKDLMGKLGSANLDCRQDGSKIGGPRASYIFNSTIAGIDEADACLIVGANVRAEAPIINSRLRKRWRATAGDFKVGIIGEKWDPTYKNDYLGAGPDTLQEILDGKNEFAKVLEAAEKPMIIVGMGALSREDGDAVLAATRAIAEKYGMVAGEWNGFNVLHTAASRVGGLDLGFVPGEGGLATNDILDGAANGDIEVVYLLGADEVDMSKLEKAFVIYQGAMGDAGAQAADVILPGAAYTEKNGTYVNTEGRAQQGWRAIFPVGDAREDWAIVRALSGALDLTLPYNNIDAVRERMVELSPTFASLNVPTKAEWTDFGKAGDMKSDGFVSPVRNFYMTDPISRASVTMAKCTEAFVKDAAAEKVA